MKGNGMHLGSVDKEKMELGRTAENFERTANFLSPTETATRELLTIYRYFNRCFFNGELPECMLTLDQSGKCVLGYFQPYGFASRNGTVIHQISLNPEYLLTRDLKDVCSTIVHEQCHLARFESLEIKRSTGYHDKHWAQMMEKIGLVPSDTGLPGGKKTGHRMSHYIEKGGVFDKAASVLIESNFAISWGLATLEIRAKAAGINSVQHGDSSNTKDRRKGKIKFICPACSKPCWASPARNLICGDDRSVLIKAE